MRLAAFCLLLTKYMTAVAIEQCNPHLVRINELYWLLKAGLAGSMPAVKQKYPMTRRDSGPFGALSRQAIMRYSRTDKIVKFVACTRCSWFLTQLVLERLAVIYRCFLTLRHANLRPAPLRCAQYLLTLAMVLGQLLAHS
ncbi:hypothetical protein QBC42DRAFT_284984 [Cladorrhinum samala]|uniref:Secreted protein n=1 Tax=Cladorrhinum samala TaxID=585594 RepID=A0AAV9HU54_9PEZI|nr:hypothetical protein QBC42DRAFT_284984 [Cladorrhinum samala]